MCIAASLVYGEQTIDEIHEYDTLRRYDIFEQNVHLVK